MKHRRQGFLQGALVLVVATVVVKVLGALFKIPLTKILGGGGMGYFMTAYGFFNPIYALSIAGFPVAVSKMVSQCAARHSYRDIRRILAVSVVIFAALGALLSGVIFFGAGAFSKAVGNPTARLAVTAIAPAVFFGCINSAFRGYNEGLRNMFPTALSQMAEALTKLGAGIAFSIWSINFCYQDYQSTGMVLGIAASSAQHALTLTLPYAAAAAVFGVAMSTAAGTVYLTLRQMIAGDGFTSEQLRCSPPPMARRHLAASLLKFALPVCLGALAVNLTSVIDLASIMKRLAVAAAQNPAALYGSHQGAIPDTLAISEIPNFLYGSYTSMAVTIFNLVPAITTSFGISALPIISALWTQRKMPELRRNIESVLRLTALIVLPAGLGMSVMSGPILGMIFSSNPAEVAVATPLLKVLGIAVIFVAMATPVNSMLQGIGLAYMPVKLMCIGGVIKIVVNHILVASPGININGAPYGTLSCYLFIMVASLIALHINTDITIDVYSVFLKPFFSAVTCALAAWMSYFMTPLSSCGRMGVLLSLAIAVLVYCLALLMTRSITRNDLSMLNKGEKMANALAKLHFLG